MTRRTTDTMTSAALRDLDPAPTTVLTEAERERADTSLARILASPGPAPLHVESDRPLRRRSRLLMAAGLVGVAGTAIPALLLGGGSAYGSWTPTPEPLTTEAAAAAAATCRAALDVRDRGERVVVAEQRGEWTYVLLAGPQVEATCLMPDDLVGQDPGDRHELFGSFDAHAVAPPTLEPDRIVETASMEGSTDEGWFNLSEGHVGRDVTGVTVHTSSGLDIEASVEGRRFAAWWPSHAQDSDHPAETWSYSVRLADGSTRRTTG